MNNQPPLFTLTPDRPALSLVIALIQSPNGNRQLEVEATQEALESWKRRGWKVLATEAANASQHGENGL